MFIGTETLVTHRKEENVQSSQSEGLVEKGWHPDSCKGPHGGAGSGRSGEKMDTAVVRAALTAVESASLVLPAAAAAASLA